MPLASDVINLLWPKPAPVPPHGLELHNGLGSGPSGSRAPANAASSGVPKTGEQRSRTTTSTESAGESRSPYIHCMLAGGIGGTTGDLLMHSLDTVKTRQQGDPHFPPKYASMSSSYATIFRQEGVRRGLYGGVLPALLGSFSGTLIFFGVYEYTKRNMIDRGFNAQLSYFSGGLVADLAASVVYVPSEVLKTRLQLQGRHNNPFFSSGYNYRSTPDALRTIIRQEGVSALFYGYKATLVRDLPFSALQFAFYEQGQTWAKESKGSRHIGMPLEIATAATAGGLAGIMTCPLDVVKTRIQTQLNPSESYQPTVAMQSKIQAIPLQSRRTTKLSPGSAADKMACPPHPTPTSSPSPAPTGARLNATTLDTSSVIKGLRLIYQKEGVSGWFRGLGPRFVWTSVQSTTMLVLYQILLRRLESHPLVEAR